MKIICKDNYDRETISDYLVCENVNEYYGGKILTMLITEETDIEKYYTLVEDDYKLYKFEP